MSKQAKQKATNDKFLLPRKSLKHLSKSQPDIKVEPFYPVGRKMKFIDLDNSIDTLKSRGWKSLGGESTPNTTDTIMFKSGNIIPVEIKSRNNDAPASDTAKKSTNRSLAKKLATFVVNLYSIHGKTVSEYWVITSFHKGESIGKNIKDQAITLVNNCEWVEPKKQITKSIKSVKIKEIKSEAVKKMELDGYNKSPKWFADAYESETIKIKNKNKVIQKVAKQKVTLKTKNQKVVANTNVASGATTTGQFSDYMNQQKLFQARLIKSIDMLVTEISAMRKDSKAKEFIVKQKN